MTKSRVVAQSVLVFLMFACRGTIEEEKIARRAVIEYVDFETTTPVHIDRNLFEKYFAQDISVVTVGDGPFLDSLNLLIGRLKPTSEGYKPDVRMLIKLFYPDSSVKIVSLSDLALDVDDSAMTFEPNLLSLVKSRIK